MKDNLYKKLFVLTIVIIAGLFSIPGCQKDKPPEPCYPPYPTGLFADPVTATSATLHVDLNFTSQDKQAFVGFSYKPANDTTWIMSSNEDPVWVYNLLPGTTYEYYATSQCSDQNGIGYRSSLVHAYFTTLNAQTGGCDCRVRPRPPGCGGCGF